MLRALGALTTNEEGLVTLERVKGETSSTTRVHGNQLERYRTFGTAINRNYFVCRKYLKKMTL